MPNFKFSGLDIPRVQKLSGLLSEELAQAIDCPTDWITFSVGAMGDGNLFCNGELLRDTVFVHVEWFDRGQPVKDTVAKIITDGVMDTKRLKFAQINTVDVIFVDIEKSNYYENGTHY